MTGEPLTPINYPEPILPEVIELRKERKRSDGTEGRNSGTVKPKPEEMKELVTVEL